MGPKEFFNRSVDVIANQSDSALVIGYVGRRGTISHQVAVATHIVEGQEALTVLTADIDPANEEITEFSTSNVAPELIDTHIGDDTGAGVFDLRHIPTALGGASIALFEVSNPDDPGEPGYWEGEWQVIETEEEYASVDERRFSIEALSAKFADHPALAMDAEYHAELSQG